MLRKGGCEGRPDRRDRPNYSSAGRGDPADLGDRALKHLWKRLRTGNAGVRAVHISRARWYLMKCAQAQHGVRAGELLTTHLRKCLAYVTNAQSITCMRARKIATARSLGITFVAFFFVEVSEMHVFKRFWHFFPGVSILFRIFL